MPRPWKLLPGLSAHVAALPQWMLLALLLAVQVAIFVFDLFFLPVQLQGVTFYAAMMPWVVRLRSKALVFILIGNAILLNQVDGLYDRDDLWVNVMGIALLMLIGALSLQSVLAERAERQRADENEQLRLQLHAEHERSERNRRDRELLLSLISHDVVQPLTHIQIDIALLDHVARGSVVEDAATVHERITGNAELLRALIQDLLDLAEGEAGSLKVTPDEFPLPEVMWRAARSFHLGEHPRVHIVVDCPPDLPAVLADRQRTEQVIRNLLANAIKYAPPGTVARLIARRTGDMLVVSVEDEGPGVPAAIGRQIFEPFVRLPRDQRGGIPGRGLGLAVSQLLVHGQGGRIWVETSQEQRTAFRFTVPLARPSCTSTNGSLPLPTR